MANTKVTSAVIADGAITPSKIASGDFYFDTDTLYVDSTNNRVGIATASPSSKLHAIDTSAADSQVLRLGNGYTTDATNDAAGLMFGLYRSYSPSVTDSGFIKSVKEKAWDSTSNRDAALTFGTRAGASEPEERMRIDSNGQLLLGTTTSDSTLSVDIQNTSASSNNTLVRIKNTFASEDAGLIIDGNNGGQQEYRIGVNTVVNVTDLTFSGGTGYRFYTGSTERLRIESDGKIKISNNIPMWSGAYGGALVLKGDNATSNRYAQLSIVDSNGTLLYDGLIVNNVGNIGIGTTSPVSSYGFSRTLEIYHGTNAEIALSQSTKNWSMGVTAGMNYNQTTSGNGYDWQIGGSSKARITSSGNILSGTTYDGFGSRFIAYGSGSGTDTVSMTSWNGGGSGCKFLQFINSGGSVIGSITQTASNTVQYNTSSDYRLKENIEYEFNALERVAQLKPARFNFISTPEVTTDGFLAHEVQDIVPEAIHGVKDEMKEEEYEVTPAELDEDGNVVTEAVMGIREVPVYQGIDQSKLVPLLTKAIQEQQTIIDDLKARIETLENA